MTIDKVVAVLCSEHACKLMWPGPHIGYAPGFCDISYCDRHSKNMYVVGESEAPTLGSCVSDKKGLIKENKNGQRIFVAEE